MSPSRPTAWQVGKLARTAALVAGFAAGPGLPAQPEAPLAVTDIRHWSLEGATRIAIEVTGEFDYRSERLSDPDRIYFDVLSSRPRLSGDKVHTIRVGDHLLKQIRVAQPQPDLTRIVFDLAAPVDVSSAQLANPDRLMVELRAVTVAQALPPALASSKPGLPVAQVLPPALASSKPGLPVAPVLPTAPIAPKASPAPEMSAAQPSRPAEQKVPRPARRDQAGGRSLVRALGLKLTRVVVDPGHGGHDTGTIGPTGLMEKDLVLDVALRLGKLIEAGLGAEVVYTRTDNTFVPLEERTAIANERKADLFLSIHANSGARSAAGPETYYLNFHGSPEALDVAARENASSEKTIHELKDLLQKIALTEKVEESREFAARVQSALVVTTRKSNNSARDRGVRQAPFLVLIGASMPSVLTEIGFVSNASEERLLKRPAHRKRVAAALFRGLSDYASSLSRFQVAGRKSQ